MDEKEKLKRAEIVAALIHFVWEAVRKNWCKGCNNNTKNWCDKDFMGIKAKKTAFYCDDYEERK